MEGSLGGWAHSEGEPRGRTLGMLEGTDWAEAEVLGRPRQGCGPRPRCSGGWGRGTGSRAGAGVLAALQVQEGHGGRGRGRLESQTRVT